MTRCVIKRVSVKFKGLSFSEQVNVCSPSGLDCFRQIGANTQLCLPPCRGLYLDVNVNKDIPPIEGKLEFQPAFKSYLEWKKGNHTNGIKNQVNDNNFRTKLCECR